MLLCQRYSIVSGENLCYTIINRTDRNSVQQLQRRLPYEEIPLRRISADGAHDALHQRAGERTEI